jgi:glutamine amidotransferase-like uncharacterized protein
VTTETGLSAQLYFNGGCTFTGEGAQVLARYGDIEGMPPAIISCAVGHGRALLSGVHFEIDPWKLSEKLVPMSCLNPLREGDSARRTLIQRLLDYPRM